MKTLFASRLAVNSRPWVLPVLLVCTLLSGFAALVYQTAWTRQFALVFGTTEAAVATVLAAYMAGLALGAWLVQRFLPFIERPVLAYAVLELLVGASSVALVPTLVTASDWLLRDIFGHQAGPPSGQHLLSITFFYIGSAFVVLAVPAACLGATLPLLARHVVISEHQIGNRVGLLYACNTVGAAAGALAGSFWLLPRVGLDHTVWSAAAVNVLVFLLALPIVPRARRRRTGFSAAWSAASRVAFSAPPAAVWILPLMLLSGGVALFHEVLWTRLLSHVLGSSLYAFGTMLASFLAGIALGGFVGAAFAREQHRAINAFAVSQLGCAIAAIAAYVLLDRFLPGLTASKVPLAAAILMPIAFFSGATFPLAVRILARRADDAAPAAARVYAWNTLGAILGALAAGFLLIPWLRFEGAIQLAVLSSSVLAIGAAWMLESGSRGPAIAISIVSLATAIVFWPHRPEALLRASPLQISNAGRMLYYGVGRSASVVVLGQDGTLAFRTNGLPEAVVELRGAAPRVSGEKWLTPLAILAKPDTQSMLIVGYGGGVVLESVPASVKRVDVIEIEPRVIDANIATRALRANDPLTDPRVNLVINDARAALSLTDRRYDAIVSQPSHPWTAAASHLYTREFMQQAREHLNDGGVFVLWMNLTFLDEQLLRSLAATVLDVFSQARVYRPDPYTLVFLASGHRIAIGPIILTGEAPDAFTRSGISSAEDVTAALAADTYNLRHIAGHAPLITDDRNRMATASMYESGRAMSLAALDRLFAPYDPLRRPAPRTLMGAATGDADPAPTIAYDYIARRVAALGSIDPGARDRLAALADGLDPASEEGYEVNAVRLATDGDHDAAQELIQQGLARHPDSEALRYEYIKPWLTRLARGTATREIAAQAARLTASAGAVVQGSELAANQRWDELAMLDGLLATARWTDPWKFDAIELRTQWRLSLDAAADLRRHHGAEALAIIDEAVAVQPALMLYALRVQSALAAHRVDATVESIWEYGHGLFTNTLVADSLVNDSSASRESESDQSDRAQARATLQGLLLLLSAQAGADRVRVEEVRARLREDVSQLSSEHVNSAPSARGMQ